MFENNYFEQKSEVSGWWNTENIKKWDRMYDDYTIHDIEYLRNRQNIVLEYIDLIKREKNISNVLELGYGAGQTALELRNKGLEVYGIDISHKLYEIAIKRLKENNLEEKCYLKVGSIEESFGYEDNSFDVVIVIGALQYLYDISSCFSEIYRVLKPGGYFIFAQRNHHSLSSFTSLREISRTIIHFLLFEKYELFPSYKSLLIDSKLGKYFKKYRDCKFMNTNFMTKGYDNWKYKIDKKLIFPFLLKKLLKNCNFNICKIKGSYYCFSEKQKYYRFNIKFDRFFRNIADSKYVPYLDLLGRSIVIMSQK